MNTTKKTPGAPFAGGCPVAPRAVLGAAGTVFHRRKAWGAIAAVGVMLFVQGCSGTGQMHRDLVWPSQPEQARVRYVTSLRSARHYTRGALDDALTAVAGTDSEGAFRRPFGVAVDTAGNVYVTDTELHDVVVFDRGEREVRRLSVSGGLRFDTPVGIAVTPGGSVIVADSKLRSVFAVNRQGMFLRGYGTMQDYAAPCGVAFDASTQRLYVVDANLHRVRVYSEDGRFLSMFGRRGGGDGEFNFPTHIAAKDGRVYVVDSMNGRVEVFDADGVFLFAFGALGTSPGRFSRPKGVAAGAFGRICVADAAFDNYQIFDSTGAPLMFIGQSGDGAGEFNLPAGVAIDDGGRIYVADQLNARVQVFQFLGGK